MDRLVALTKTQTGNRPYVPNTLYLFWGGVQTALKGMYSKRTDGFCYYKELSESHFQWLSNP